MADDPNPPAVPRDASRWSARLAIVATLVTLVPFVVAVVAQIGRHVEPIGDFAIIDLRTRDVFGSWTPLLGAYSRFGWNHPGPAMYWLLAPLSALTGGAAWAIYASCAAVQGAGVAWSARLAWRRGGTLLTLLVLTVQVLTYVGLRLEYPLLRPWNPTMALPFFTVFALLVWSVVLGEVRRLPAAAGVGAFLVVTHVGYAPLVAAGAAWVVGGLWAQRRATDGSRLRRALLVTAAVVAVLWLPAVIEQIQHGAHGNFVELARSMAGHRLPNSTQASVAQVGMRRGLGVFAEEFRWVPTWLGGRDPVVGSASFVVPAPQRWLLAPVLLLTVAAFASWRTRDRRLTTAFGIVATLAAVGAITLTQLRGELVAYAFYWRVPLALLVVAVAVGAVWRWLDASRRRWAVGAAAAVLATAIVVGSVATTVRIVHGDGNPRIFEHVVDDLTGQLGPHLPRARTVLLQQAADIGIFSGVMVGLVDHFDREGVPVAVSPRYAAAYLDGRHRISDRDPVHWVVAEGSTIGWLEHRPGVHLIASVTPLAPRAEHRLRVLQRRVRGELVAAGRDDLVWLMGGLALKELDGVPGVARADLVELADLNAEVYRSKRYRYGVFAFRGAPPPKLVAY